MRIRPNHKDISKKLLNKIMLELDTNDCCQVQNDFHQYEYILFDIKIEKPRFPFIYLTKNNILKNSKFMPYKNEFVIII